MTSHNGPETSDSVNLGSNPSSPATTNADISGVSGNSGPAERPEPEEQNADTGRTKVGTTLADTVVLDPGINPEDVRACLIDNVNLGWRAGGNDGRCNVPANFVGWLLQEHDRQLAWREDHPYSELDMDMHVEAVTKDLRAEIERLRAALESLTKDPPSTLAREPDEDHEVIWKMRAIAREALGIEPAMPEIEAWHLQQKRT